MALTLHSNMAYAGNTDDLPFIPHFNDLSVKPAFAFSLKRLFDYNGPCITVEHMTTLETKDIGFKGGVVDKVALLAFANGDSLRVTKLFNQSGDASAYLANIAASNQAKIVIQGELVTDSNGDPSIHFSYNLQCAYYMSAKLMSNLSNKANLAIKAKVQISGVYSTASVDLFRLTQNTNSKFYSNIPQNTLTLSTGWRNASSDDLVTTVSDALTASVATNVYSEIKAETKTTEQRIASTVKNGALVADYTPQRITQAILGFTGGNPGPNYYLISDFLIFDQAIAANDKSLLMS